MKRGFQNQNHGSGQDSPRDRGWCSTTSDSLQGNWLCQERRWLEGWRHILTKILPHFNASKIWSIPFRQRKEFNLHSARVEIETFEFWKFASLFEEKKNVQYSQQRYMEGSNMKFTFHICFHKGIGGQIRDNWRKGDGTTSVQTIRIADFINNVVATRRFAPPTF